MRFRPFSVPKREKQLQWAMAVKKLSRGGIQKSGLGELSQRGVACGIKASRPAMYKGQSACESSLGGDYRGRLMAMPRKFFYFWATVLLCTLAVGRLPIAFAQYRSRDPYPYQRAPTPSLPTSARHVGGFIGNPYRNDRVTPTGLPIGRSLQAYYGGGFWQSSGGNPFGHRSVQKPFSYVIPPRPLITSREAATIEVSRGLWLW